ncbi:MAG TPA: ABC transporter permease [Symbiobacteriaceae bacterium]|jgi:oligopeptide transport system permease protein|nr:ABC transporter permease [Symbiobacteriaceae bacterium]
MAAPLNTRFAPLPNRQAAAERITTPPQSFISDAWRRFKANRTALFGLALLVIFFLLAFVGPYLSSHSYADQVLKMNNKPPSSEYWLGTDANGRDLLVRIMIGGRISLAVAFFAALLQLGVGVIYGATAGLMGGRVDNLMMRIVDIIDTIPLTIYVILLAVVLTPGLTSIFLAIGMVYWTSMARLVRAQVLSLKEQEFMLAARALGASRWRLVVRHLVPNAMAPIIVELTFSIPRAIFTEAFLSFIGLGVSAPMASWGVLASDGFKGLRSYPWQLAFPAAAIILTTLAFNFVGDGLRDALDPKLRK